MVTFPGALNTFNITVIDGVLNFCYSNAFLNSLTFAE